MGSVKVLFIAEKGVLKGYLVHHFERHLVPYIYNINMAQIVEFPQTTLGNIML